MLSDEDKTREQLISELAVLRQRVAELDTLESEHKRMEEALRESEERFRAIAESARDSIITINSQRNIVYWNNAAEITFGYSANEAIGKPLTLIMPERFRKAYHDAMNRIVSAGKSTIFGKAVEMVGLRKDGSEFPAELSLATWKTREGIFFTAITRDTTERKRVEEALRESESFLNSVIEQSPFSTWISDAEGTNIRQNQACRELFGIERDEEVIGKYNLFKDEEVRRQGFMPLFEKVFTKGKTVNFVIDYDFQKVKHVKVSGATHKILDATIFPIKDSNGKVTNAVVQHKDITERKWAEEELKESEARYRALIRLSGEVGEAVIMLIDTEEVVGLHTFASVEWSHITGYSRKELLAMSFFDLVHPKDRAAAMGRHHRRKQESVPGLYEISIVRKDGTEVPIEITAARTTYKGKLANVGYIRDITERKQAEEREKELQRELALSSRLASIGELAAGIAHELNNPLTGILGFSERLLRKSTNEEVSRDLERIHDEAERTAKVIRNLLAFARRSETKKEYSDMNDIVQEALELRAYELKTGNIEVVADLTPSLPGVIADFRQIQEVFLNIILNAEQSMIEANGGGKLSVKTKQMKNCVSVSFTDNGPGIPEEHRDKLFDPFFTTRGEKGGTGLGLSVCHGIVTEHGGKIYAKSKPGKGATFFVELPLTSEKIDEAKVAEELGRQGNVSE